MNISIKVPVKAYLKKYVLYVENVQSEPLVLKDARHVGFVLANIITGSFPHYPYENNFSPEYDDMIEVKLNLKHWYADRIHVPIEGIRFFNAFLHRSFHDWLQERIAFGRRLSINETDVINEVMHELDIIEDISFEALKKASYRLRKAKKNRENCSRNRMIVLSA